MSVVVSTDNSLISAWEPGSEEEPTGELLGRGGSAGSNSGGNRCRACIGKRHDEQDSDEGSRRRTFRGLLERCRLGRHEAVVTKLIGVSLACAVISPSFRKRNRPRSQSLKNNRTPSYKSRAYPVMQLLFSGLGFIVVAW